MAIKDNFWCRPSLHIAVMWTYQFERLYLNVYKMSIKSSSTFSYSNVNMHKLLKMWITLQTILNHVSNLLVKII